MYDEAAGDPDNGIAPGTRWEDLPEDFVCPLCGVGKDRSKVLFAFLPDRAYMTLMRYEKYGMLVLFMLVWLGVGDNILSEGIYRVYELLVNWIVY